MNPNKLDKYLYIRGLQTWKVRTLYIFGIASWLLVLWGFSGAVLIDPFYRWFIAPILVVFSVYHLLSFTLNLWYKQFDPKEHRRRISSYWKHRQTTKPLDLIPALHPSVDIFLPICGEDIEILHNTWKHVARLHYDNKKIYVLDDSTQGCSEHKKLAKQFGFHYFERPNKGEMKKAGNLKYAYERTTGDFIAIFDADFAPHPEFLRELLPYTTDPSTGIVQSPQYFEASERVYKTSRLAYAAAYHEELFYRIIQVAKDRLGGAICCGTNAIYRRAALKTIGGPRQVDASEDSRTGFALAGKGWRVKYVPVILAIGVCPNNIYSYFHQQHRWCRGRSELVLSREFIVSPVSLIVKLCNLSGFLAFLSRPLTIIMSFQLFWIVFIYNEYISFENAAVFYPYMIFALFVLPAIHITRFKPVVFYAGLAQIYASTHALLNVFLGKPGEWIATGTKTNQVSPAFQQTMYALGWYTATYLLLIFLAALVGFIRLFDIQYYSVQFWLFYNLALSVVLYTQMYRYHRSVKVSAMLT